MIFDLLRSFLVLLGCKLQKVGRPRLNLVVAFGLARRINYKLIIGWQCRQEMGKIPKYTDSEQLMTPKTDYLLSDYEGEESISMDFQVCQPQKTRVLCHLKAYPQSHSQTNDHCMIWEGDYICTTTQTLLLHQIT